MILKVNVYVLDFTSNKKSQDSQGAENYMERTT